MKIKLDNKNLLVIGLAAVGAFLLFKSMKKKDTSNQGTGGNEGENPNPNPNPPTPSNLDYKKLAETLYEAMNGYGTTEEKIYLTLGLLKSKADWDALVSAYGTRTLSSGTWNVFNSDYTGNLSGSFKSELSATELGKVADILKKIGVTI
jgi:hypothetical protein